MNADDSLDPLAKRLLKLDEALERGLHHASGVTQSEENTARAATGDTAEVNPGDLELEDCLQLIEAVRVIHPDALADVFEVNDRAEGASNNRVVELAEQTEFPTATRIGRFELVRQLGQGGYGVVFLANDPTLDRHVALKVPRPEVLITAGLRDRFLREAEAAAALDHPHIVPVYEAGSAGPVCYIASAYCGGGSLSQWLHQREQVMEPQVAAEVTAVLANAVQHAHDRGILHRDIKPGNVLLDEPLATDSSPDRTLADRVRLADFGLARVLLEPDAAADSETDSPAFEETMTAGIAGTPAYMAPEQAANRREEIGPATDVYALGATLYHLLTGRPPLVAASPVETLTAIMHEEPVEPMRHQRSVPPDLNAVCMKAICKEPAGRYASAADLASDLLRFANGEQVVARPISQLQRTARWCRNNPIVTTWAAIAISAILAAMAIAFAGWWNTSRSLQREQAALASADEAYQETREAIDEYFVKVSQDKLLRTPGMTALRKDLLESALRYYSRFVDRHQHDHRAVEDLRKSYRFMAEVHTELGQPEAALGAYERLLDLTDQALAKEADESRQQELRFNKGTILRMLARTRMMLGQLQQASVEIKQARAIHETLVEDGYREPENRYQIAQLIGNQGSLWHRSGEPIKAEAAYSEAAAALSELADAEALIDEAADGELKLRLAQIQGNRAVALRTMGRQDEAEEILESVAAAFKELVQDFPDDLSYHENLGKAHANLSLFDELAGDLRAAYDHLMMATDSFDYLANRFPQVAKYQVLAASTRRKAAGLANDLFGAQDAKRLCDEAIHVLDRIRDTQQVVAEFELAQTQMLAARLALNHGEVEEARALAEAALSGLHNYHALNPNDPIARLGLAEAHRTLAVALVRLNEFATAQQLAADGLGILSELSSSNDHPSFGPMAGSLWAVSADALEGDGQLGKSIEHREQALSLTPRPFQPPQKLALAITLARDRQTNGAAKLLTEIDTDALTRATEMLQLAKAHALLAGADRREDARQASQQHLAAAIRWLKKAAASKALPQPLAKRLEDPAFEILREHPEILALLNPPPQ